MSKNILNGYFKKKKMLGGLMFLNILCVLK